MQEIIAYAAVYVAEASITGVYLDYLFDKKRKRCLHLLSFALTYGILFGISMWNIPILNAVCFTLVNFLLIAFLYRCGLKTALIHAAFLCFLGNNHNAADSFYRHLRHASKIQAFQSGSGTL